MTKFYNKRLIKKADTYNDIVGATLSHPFTLGIGSAVGGIHGLLSDKVKDKDLDAIDQSPGLSYLPGVGISRIVRRRRNLSNKKGEGSGKIGGQIFGGLTSSLLLTGALALTGGLVGAGAGGFKKGTAIGAGVGAGVGIGTSVVANVLGSLIGRAKRARTAAQQQQYQWNRSAGARNYLLPGAAAYNFARSSKAVLDQQSVRNREKAGEIKRLK